MKHQPDKNRRILIAGIGMLMGALTLVSFSASYSIYQESFVTWGLFGKILAMAAASGVEVAFALSIFALGYTAVGAEKTIAAAGTCALLLIMAVNFSVHSQNVRGLALASWQETYKNYVGGAVIFGVIGYLILLTVTLYESRERALQRQIERAGLEAALNYRLSFLQSNAFSASLDSTSTDSASQPRSRLRRRCRMASSSRPPSLAVRAARKWPLPLEDHTPSRRQHAAS